MEKITTENILQRFKENPNVKITNLSDINWTRIILNNYLSISFIEKIISCLGWYDLRLLARYQILSMKIIEKYSSKFDEDELYKNQKLSDFFILSRLTDSYITDLVIEYQKLSDSTILKILQKYPNRLAHICKHQKLSDSFIKNNFNFLKEEWGTLLQYQDLEICTLKLMNKLLGFGVDKVYRVTQKNNIENIHLSPYKIKKDIYGEYITSYKAVRIDGYSLYNFQYRYVTGKTYFSACDSRPQVLDSWGLSAWTLKDATLYGKYSYRPFKIIKVKIYLSDIGVILPQNNFKIRARSLTVMNKMDLKISRQKNDLL